MTAKQDYRNKRKALMLAAYYGGDQEALDMLYRQGEHADGERCPDCEGADNILSAGVNEYHCADCGHNWSAAEYDIT